MSCIYEVTWRDKWGNLMRRRRYNGIGPEGRDYSANMRGFIALPYRHCPESEHTVEIEVYENPTPVKKIVGYDDWVNERNLGNV